MDALFKDIRYALRTLTRSPAFTAIAILTIGLGIGANTAIFSVVNAVLLRPLPYSEPDRLMLVWSEFTNRNLRNFPTSPPNLQDYREQSNYFEGFEGVITFQQALTGGDADPQQIQVGGVTPDFFVQLGVSPMLGRDFVDDDAAPIGVDAQGNPLATPPAAVVLGYGLWRARFGGESGVIGTTLELAGNAAEIVGVMPSEFKLFVPPGSGLSPEVDAWVTPRIDFESWPSRANVVFTLIGRLKHGVTVEQAQAEMDGIAARIREIDQLHDTGGFAIEVVPMLSDITEQVRPIVFALLGAVGFVLLIAAANVSNLLLVRATAREREIAIRAAIGGTRGRLIRQLLVESSVLALLGGAVGLLLAQGGIELLLALRPADLPRIESVGIDDFVLGFTLLASLATAFIFGTIPAIQASRPNLAESLKDRGRSSGLTRQKLFRNSIVVGEVALSVILLIGAGLMVRSFAELENVNPGFNSESVLTFGLSLPGARYPDLEQRESFNRLLQGRLAGLPGVESVSAAVPLPLDGQRFAGRYGPEEALTDESLYGQATYRIVQPDYFQTMGTRLLAGRIFSAADVADSAAVVVIDQKLAGIVWPGGSPIGKRMLIRVTTTDAQFVEVIGLVENVRDETLAQEGRETVYFHNRYVGVFGNLKWIVRSSIDPLGLAGQARAEVAAMDPLLPVADVRTMDSYVSEAMAPTRFALILISIFSIIALALASVGLYGVLSYVVRQRTAEIGVRMAFGAEAGSILKLIMRQGMTLTIAGLVAGLIGAFWLTRFMASLLVGIAPTDPMTFVGISAVFLAVAAMACLIPARRATLVDPVVALREE